MFLIGFEQMPSDIVWFFYQHIKLSSMKDLDVNKTKPPTLVFAIYMLPLHRPSRAELLFVTQNIKISYAICFSPSLLLPL